MENRISGVLNQPGVLMAKPSQGQDKVLHTNLSLQLMASLIPLMEEAFLLSKTNPYLPFLDGSIITFSFPNPCFQFTILIPSRIITKADGPAKKIDTYPPIVANSRGQTGKLTRCKSHSMWLMPFLSLSKGPENPPF